MPSLWRRNKSAFSNLSAQMAAKHGIINMPYSSQHVTLQHVHDADRRANDDADT